MSDESGDTRTMPERCRALAASGKPCSATARPGRPYCLWHDPEAATYRTELSRRGGKARSNAARAAKQMPEALTSSDLVASLSRALRKVEVGELEAGPANAMANLARAIVAVRTTLELEQRLGELEERVSSGRARA